MSPVLLREQPFIFWIHSHDAVNENRASVHVGLVRPNDSGDAKVWLEPMIEVVRAGRTLKAHELRKALEVIEDNHAYLLEEWRNHGS